MLKSWNDFETRRTISLIYAKNTSESNYINALSYFELLRKYYQKNGFPPPKKEFFKSGERKGQPKPYSEKEQKDLQEEIRKWIHEEKIKKFKGIRASNKGYTRRTGR